jgi:hypothetical protein
MTNRILMMAVALAACTKQPNPCTSDSDCTNPAYPFCDVDGEFAVSGGEKNTCTIVPPNCPVERCGCSPGATTCAAGELRTCDASGVSETATACALGCAPDGARCLSFEPSNGLGPALAAAANERAIEIPDGATINTDTGEVKTSGGLPVDVQSLVIAQGHTTIRAFIGGSFAIGDVTAYGNNPLAIVATGDITVTGMLDASAESVSSGPGAQRSDPCAGQPSSYGGSGGGNATDGGGGGEPQVIINNPRVPGGIAQIGFEPLAGGCPGGPLTSNGSVVADGGGGGGAVQLVSLTTIAISGGIDVGGGGGGYDGGGGGSGGNVILEAPRVAFASGGIYANGGSGGACAMSGTDGTRDANAAPGAGPCGDHNRIRGGDGGTESTVPFGGGRDLGGGSGGGGGGAVGRLRIATSDGTYDAGTAVLSAAITTATLQAN